MPYLLTARWHTYRKSLNPPRDSYGLTATVE